ncbi:MAG: hypothetical protein HZA51_11015 [Planctomycetes bacterium]|nr:hypothetical protein [Planctomycetota bacterium]
MIVRTGILGLAVLVCAVGTTADAQQTRQGGGASAVRGGLDRVAGMRQAPRYISSATSNRNRRGTYKENAYSGVLTRMDQVRALMPRRSKSLIREYEPLPPGPIQVMLDRRNLLSVRSPIARKATASIGRNIMPIGLDPGQNTFTFLPPRQTTSTSVTTQPVTQSDTLYQDVLANRLGRLAEEYYTSGSRAFSKKQWITAKNYFDLVRELEPDKPRAHIAMALVSTQRAEFASAWMHMLKAIGAARTADDLRIDVNQFFTSPDELRKTREEVNRAAQRFPELGSIAGMLAYYSFLNGDLGTAADAAANAEKNTPEDYTAPIKKFRGMLLELRTAPASRPAI